MSGNHPREFKKRSLLFVGVHNEALTVAAVCVSNKDRSPFTIHSCDTAPTPTGFADVVGDELLVIHTRRIVLLFTAAFPRRVFGNEDRRATGPIPDRV